MVLIQDEIYEKDEIFYVKNNGNLNILYDCAIGDFRQLIDDIVKITLIFQNKSDPDTDLNHLLLKIIELENQFHYQKLI